MAKLNELSVSDLRSQLPSVLHRALAFGESFLILKHGQPFAVLSPLTDKEEIERVRAKLSSEGADREPVDDVLDAESIT